MSSSKLERVCLLGDPSTQIELLDRQRRSVARAMGELVADVPAGLYVVSTSAGGEAGERMISVEPGRGYEDRGLRSSVPSTAPVLGTHASPDRFTGHRDWCCLFTAGWPACGHAV